MHIKIVGFKIHLEADFTFKNGEMTLLRSESGGGKTTILQAIFWALYGNMRGIYNNTRITKNLSVCLSLPGITIFRKKNPDLLTVTLSDGKIYDDKIGQTIIDNTYGHRELWKACSYIEQKSRCSLLSGTGGERMELLNALSFTGENPKEHISKITAFLKENTAEFEKTQSIFIHELNLYTKSLSEKPIKFLYSEDDISKIREKILELDISIKSKHEEVLSQEQLLGTRNYLLKIEQELSDKNKILNCRKTESPILVNFNESEIQLPLVAQNDQICELDEKVIITYNDYSNMKTQYGFELKKYLEQISIEKEKKRLLEEKTKLNEQRKMERKKLETELKEVEVDINKTGIGRENVKNIKQEDIWNVSKLETERGKNLDECKSIGLVYDEKIIKKTINELSEQLKRYNLFDSQIENYNKLVQIENKLSSFSQFKEENITVLENLQKEKSILINEMKKGLELLSCPKCGVSLRYQNSILSIGDRDPVSKSDILLAEREYLQLSEKIQKYREMVKLEENRDFISKTVDKMDIEEYINSNAKNKVSSLSALIHRISKIRYIPEIVESSEMLTSIYNYQNLLRKRDHLKSNLEECIRLQENELSENIETNNENYGERYELVLSLLRDVEEKYANEQKRVLKNQGIVRKSQELEAERLRALAKYEYDKKMREERRARVEYENMEKLKKYEFEKENLESEKKNLLIRIEENRQEIHRINSKIDSKIREEHLCLIKQLEEEKSKLDDAIYTVKTLKTVKELEVKRENLLKLQNDVQALTNLRIKAVEVECKQLEDTVNNINTVLETTLPVFFKEPISLNLQLYKKMKTDIMKPGLNLEICYKGCKFDNINSLSGGEGDRISLALLLALNSVSNSPIIILDECVSSLDGDLKENCITAIKSIPNKTVICVDHDDALEGFYDSIIDI